MKDILAEQAYTEDHTGRLVAMGQMAASLAHEIRNPLGSMELYCSVLKREVKDDSSKLELVNHIQQGISSLSHIVSNCLLFTKDITVSKKEYGSAKMFLSETCRYVSSSYEHLAIVSGLPEKDCDAGLFLSWEESGEESFMMDPYVLGQIVLNLSKNALDACSEESLSNLPHHVQISIDHSDSACWTLLVCDNGKGMSEEVKERMYDPFFTTREKGTGLGLAIVYSLVKAHGGTIEVQSEISMGTRVKIKFLN